MINFVELEIGDTFVEGENETTYVITGKNYDEVGNLIGVSYTPVV